MPSKLNKMLKQGELDISPSSSIEYLRNKKKYFILPWFSISSSGPIGSILLFSKLPIEKLRGKTIAVSSDSETSVVLLKIILKEFYSINCRFRKIRSGSVNKTLSSFPAVLLIGDQAMKESKKIQTRLSSLVSRSPRAKPTGLSSLYVYDLGNLWQKHTGLPFVYALWIVRKDALPDKMELVKKLSSDLLKAKKSFVKKFPSFAENAPQRKWLSKKELVSYWKCISYDFTEKHMEGLMLFEKLSTKNKMNN